jgi:hypothetical protein
MGKTNEADDGRITPKRNRDGERIQVRWGHERRGSDKG